MSGESETKLLPREEQVLLRVHMANLQVRVTHQANIILFENREAYQIAVTQFQRSKLLGPLAVQILGLGAIFRQDGSKLEAEQWNRLGPLAAELLAMAQMAHRVLDALLGAPPDPALYLSVVFTADNPSLQDFGSDVRAMLLALDAPVRAFNEPSLQLSIVEPGCTVIELLAAGAGVIAILGAIMKWGTERAKRMTAEEETKQAIEKTKQAGESTTQSKEATKQAVEKTQQSALETEAKRIDLQIRQLDLKLKQLAAAEEAEKLDIEHWTLSHGKDPEVTCTIEASVQEWAKGLRARRFIGRLPMNAPEEMRREFPPEALPEHRGSSNQLPYREPKQLGPGKPNG